VKVVYKEPKESITIKLTEKEAAQFLVATVHCYLEPVNGIKNEIWKLGIRAEDANK
jgi:hypothetical protein